MSAEEEKKSDKSEDVMGQVHGMLDHLEHRLMQKLEGVRNEARNSSQVMIGRADELAKKLEQVDIRPEFKSAENTLNQVNSRFGNFQNQMNGLDKMPSLHEELKVRVEGLYADLEQCMAKLPQIEDVKTLAMDCKNDLNGLRGDCHLDRQSVESKFKAIKERMAERHNEQQKEKELQADQMADFRQKLMYQAHHGDKIEKEMVDKVHSAENMAKQMLADSRNALSKVEEKMKSCLMDLRDDMRALKSEMEKIGVDLDEAFKSVDFAECQGDRLKRLERLSDQHDQMIKKFHREMKGK